MSEIFHNQRYAPCGIGTALIAYLLLTYSAGF
jgi:hypothetical protein